MAYKQTPHKVQKVMVQPINLIFRYLQNSTRVLVWLHEDNFHMKIEGVILGFDEFMNIVLGEAEEVVFRKGQEGQRKFIGRIMLKGDNVSLIQPTTK